MAGRDDPPAVALRAGEERRDGLPAVQPERLPVGHGQVRGQPRQVAQGARGESGLRPFRMFFLRKTTVGKRLRQHGDDPLAVGVRRAKIAGTGAGRHGLKI